MAFEEKDPAEQVVITFDFSQELGSESIVTCSCACTVIHGVDAAPSNMLVGLPVIQGQLVLQSIHAGLAGVQYEFKAAISTSGGRILVCSGPLTVSLQ